MCMVCLKVDDLTLLIHRSATMADTTKTPLPVGAGYGKLLEDMQHDLELTYRRCRSRHRLLFRVFDDVHFIPPEPLHTVLYPPIRGVQHCVSQRQARSHSFRYCLSMDMGGDITAVIDRGVYLWCRWPFLVCSRCHSSDPYVLDPGVQSQAERAEMPYLPRDCKSEIRNSGAPGVHVVRIRNEHPCGQSTTSWRQCGRDELDGHASIRSCIPDPSW